MGHLPKILQKLLKFSANLNDGIAIMGDLEEEFLAIKSDRGRVHAWRWFMSLIFSSLHFIIVQFCTGGIGMLINYLKTTFRSLRRHPMFNIINVVGLAIGMACFLLILLFVRHELSYDRHHENADRIYRIVLDARFGGSLYPLCAVAAPTAAALEADYPEVEQAIRIYSADNPIISNKDRYFKENRVTWADEGLFDIFSIALTAGSIESLLAKPNTVAISRTTARKYFGTADPMGSMLLFDGNVEYMVTAVYEDMPTASHFHFDIIASLVTLDESREPWWLNNLRFRTYLLLNDKADAAALEVKFHDMVMKYCAPMMERFNNKSFEKQIEEGVLIKYGLQSLTSIHLHSARTMELEPNGSTQYLIIFSAIGVFILLLACVNYMNLSTARSIKRAREVGIRKTTGSTRMQLIIQFLSESLFMTFISVVIAYIITIIMLPIFNSVSGMSMTLDSFFKPDMFLIMGVVSVIVGMFSGSYPAFSLSSYPAISVIQNITAPGGKGRTVRSILVVFQFVISMVMVIGTGIVYRQVKYIQTKNVGFDKDHVMVIHDTYMLEDRAASFKDVLKGESGVINVTCSGFLPVESERLMDVMSPEGAYQEEGTPMQRWMVDEDYFSTMGMELLEGRLFSSDRGDELDIIVNEAAVKYFQWDEALGKIIKDLRGTESNEYYNYRVIGVIKDFHFASLRRNITPLVFHNQDHIALISVRIKTTDLAGLIRKIESQWKHFAPNIPFAYSFLDDRFNDMYNTEVKLGHLFSLFACLSIFIGCLGLLGLIAFLAEQKTKEIGIRKVLGAPSWSIIMLLSREMLKHVAIAGIIACPVSWFMMRTWLQQFAYRTNMSAAIFVIAIAGVLGIVLLTMSWQTLRAARANPVESLKCD